MNLKRLLILALISVVINVNGQDIHFSQYFSSPLTLNPALTGGFNGDFRVAINYRNQWFSIRKPHTYVTYAGSFDIALLRDRPMNDQLGLGLVVYSDKAGDGNFRTTSVNLSAAYHKSLDTYNRHSLTLGFAGGMVQKRVDFTKLTFENQFNGNLGFDPSLPTGENIEDDQIIYPDFTIGLLWKSRFVDNITSYAGFSYAHLSKPEETFLAETEFKNELSPIARIHGGLDIRVGDRTSILPGVLYQAQTTAQEITFGTALGYDVNDISAFYLGGWYRWDDALILLAGVEVYDFRIGFSYDVNLSDFKTATNSNGGIELSLIYIHNQGEDRTLSPVDFCPKF